MQASAEEVQLLIRDSAGNILPEVEKNLFRPFFTTKDQGQGVGLILVREILDQHRYQYNFEWVQQQYTQFAIRMQLAGRAVRNQDSTF